MNNGKMFSAFTEKLKQNKRLEYLVYFGLLAAAAIIFLVTGGISCSSKNADRKTTASEENDVFSVESEPDLERRLEEILSRIKGAGNVSVMIVYDNCSEIVPAYESQTTSNESGSSESRRPLTVSQGGAQSPLVLSKIAPKIRGVIVVAEGASDPRVRTELQNAVMTVLGTDNSRIGIYTMQH